MERGDRFEAEETPAGDGDSSMDLSAVAVSGSDGFKPSSSPNAATLLLCTKHSAEAAGVGLVSTYLGRADRSLFPWWVLHHAGWHGRISTIAYADGSFPSMRVAIWRIGVGG